MVIYAFDHRSAVKIKGSRTIELWTEHRTGLHAGLPPVVGEGRWIGRSPIFTVEPMLRFEVGCNAIAESMLQSTPVFPSSAHSLSSPCNVGVGHMAHRNNFDTVRSGWPLGCCYPQRHGGKYLPLVMAAEVLGGARGGHHSTLQTGALPHGIHVESACRWCSY